jgi:lipoate-protein ligase A
MRLPRHDTSLRLPAEAPHEALLRDETLLSEVGPGDEPVQRWWVAASPAVVVGLGLRHRLASIVDFERCRASGVDVLDRRAGGGAVLVDEHMLCGAICVPIAQVASDLTESYRWLSDYLLGAAPGRRVEVAEARADVAALRARDDPVSKVLLCTCYGALSPHEIVDSEARKLVGLAQIRRRHAALFQVGILLRDQSPMADFLNVPDEATREQLRAELQRRTVGLESLLTDREVSAVVAAIAGARPSAL